MVVFKTIFIGPCKEIRDCFWLAYHRSMTSGRNWRQPANQSNKKVKPIVNLTFISTGALQSLPLFPSRSHCVVAVLIFCFAWWAFVIISVLFMQHSLQSTSIYNLAPVSRKALCRYFKCFCVSAPNSPPPLSSARACHSFFKGVCAFLATSMWYVYLSVESCHGNNQHQSVVKLLWNGR